MRGNFLIITLFFSLILACGNTDTNTTIRETSLSEVLNDYGTGPHDINLMIVKKDYKMYVYYRGKVVKTYPVVFGGNPIEDKRMEGDKCTPEGMFGIRAKYDHKKWNKFIWIDYPNEDSWTKHKQAKRSGLIPANASIGGEIGIHGVPKGKDKVVDQKYNWTLGCISMKNKHIDDLYPHLGDNTKVLIK